jgi:hypothetical protein
VVASAYVTDMQLQLVRGNAGGDGGVSCDQ